MKKIAKRILCLCLVAAVSGSGFQGIGLKSPVVHAESAKDSEGRTIKTVSNASELESAFQSTAYAAGAKLRIRLTSDIEWGYYCWGGTMEKDVDVVLDLNGHTLTMSDCLYMNAYGRNMKLTVENGKIIVNNNFNALRVRGTEAYFAELKVSGVTILNTRDDEMNNNCLMIENEYSKVLIENCYFHTTYGYGIKLTGQKALDDGRDNTVVIKNSTLIGNKGSGISNDTPDADTPRIVWLENSSIQCTGGGLAFTKGGGAVRVPDDQVIFCNGVLSSDRTIKEQHIVQVGKESDFHELVLTASEDCRCVVMPYKTGGKFLSGKTIMLSASSEKSYEFLWYKTSDGSTDGFVDAAGNAQNTNAVTGYQMPDRDVEVCAYFKIPGVIRKFDLSGFVFPTTEITAGDSISSVEKTDVTDENYNYLTTLIFPADVEIEGKSPFALDKIYGKALKSADMFEYGKEYKVVSVVYYDGEEVTLNEDAIAELNGYQMIKSYEDTPKKSTSLCYYLPVQVNWCGKTLSDKVTWYFDSETGELRLEGNGCLADFSTGVVPWESVLGEIKKVSVSASVTGVTVPLFADMPSLEKIEVAEENPEISSADGVLYEKKEGVPVTLLFIPPGVTACDVPRTVTKVAKNAGVNAGLLKEIVLEQAVTEIEENAFSGCKNLECITILNPECKIFDAKETIYEGAKICGYSGSTAAKYANKYSRERENPNGIGREPGDDITWNYDAVSKTLTISGNGKMIDFSEDAPWKKDENIVEECKKVVLEDGIKSVGANAFSFMKFQEIVIGKDVCEIGTLAFATPNAALQSIVVSTENTAYQSDGHTLYSKDGKTMVCYAGGNTLEELTVPAGVEQILPYAFCGAGHLKKINLPDSLQTIGEMAFALTGLEEITIPKNVTKVDDQALGGSSKLKEITFLGNVDEMGDNVFVEIQKEEVTVNCHLGTNACQKAVIAGFTKINNIHFYEMIIDKAATEAEDGICHEECWYCHDKKASVAIPKTGKTESGETPGPKDPTPTPNATSKPIVTPAPTPTSIPTPAVSGDPSGEGGGTSDPKTPTPTPNATSKPIVTPAPTPTSIPTPAASGDPSGEGGGTSDPKDPTPTPNATSKPIVTPAPTPTSIPKPAASGDPSGEGGGTSDPKTPTPTPNATSTPILTPAPTAIPTVSDRPSGNNAGESNAGIPNTLEELSQSNNVAVGMPVKTVVLKSVKNKKNRKMVATWKKLTGVSGYQIQYATNRKFKKAKSKWVKKKNKTCQIKIQKKKTYFVRIRAYKMRGTTKVYGKWSKVKKVKIRK